MMTMTTTLVLGLGLAVWGQLEPITPTELDARLPTLPTGVAADVLAERIRESLPAGTDLKRGGHLVEASAVAFVIEAPAGTTSARVVGMVNHGRGLDLVPVGTTGLWARVEGIATDTKLARSFEIDGQEVANSGAIVEMPGWSYPAESSERAGRTYGEYRPLAFRSTVFGNDRTGWVYVPAGYTGAEPVALMVFQDGEAYKNERVGTVVDNLAADGKMPVTLLVLLNPGVNDDGTSNRSVEYDTLSDRYARFLAEEVLPRVGQEYRLRDEAASRAIGGASSGGIAAFTAAWHRPDLFGRVLSQIGSFTNIRGGDKYPELVRQTSPAKPIRVMLTAGTNDLINEHGDWWQANEAMHRALQEQGYAVNFLRDRGFHAFWTCGRQLPEALAWLWSAEAGR